LDNGYIQEVLKMVKNVDTTHQERKRMENRRIREIQKTIHKCDGDTKKAFTRGIGYVIDGL